TENQQTPERREHTGGVGEAITSDRIEDIIDPARTDLLGRILEAIGPDHMRRPEALHRFGLRLGRDDRDDLEAHGQAHLYRRRPQAAGGTVDEHALPGSG